MIKGRSFYILSILLLMVSCKGHSDYECLQEAINRQKATSINDSTLGFVVDFELLTDVAYLYSYTAEEKTEYAARCQQIIQVPQNVARLPHSLQEIMKSCRYKGRIYQFSCDDFWDNKYPDSVLYACLDDNGSMRVFYIIKKS